MATSGQARSLCPTLPLCRSQASPTSIPGGGGSRLTTILSSCVLARRALTASWWVAWRRSVPFTSKILSPTRSPLQDASPRGMTCRGREEGRKWTEKLEAQKPCREKSPSAYFRADLSSPKENRFLCPSLVPESELLGATFFLYLGNEDPWIMDSKGVARVITAPHNAESQGATSFDQAHLLHRERETHTKKGGEMGPKTSERRAT